MRDVFPSILSCLTTSFRASEGEDGRFFFPKRISGLKNVNTEFCNDAMFLLEHGKKKKKKKKKKEKKKKKKKKKNKKYICAVYCLFLHYILT